MDEDDDEPEATTGAAVSGKARGIYIRGSDNRVRLSVSSETLPAVPGGSFRRVLC